MKHLSMAQLEAGLDDIRRSPKDQGVLQLIVRRPAVDEREVVEQAQLHPVLGLLGDNWQARGSSTTADGSAHPEMQLTLMNARLVALVAQVKERWQLAGDQLYLDLDLSVENLPPGMQLTLGTAVLEVTAQPHTGCRKFKSRFGTDAMRFVNSSVGRELRLRGVNAKVVEGGVIRVGHLARKLEIF